ncbi:MAG TPA: hypothetical protein VL171_00790 [Verrucomicrobiae bacterium]|nr:hypothetical protein [Verrucomicrobiae bacterium]
MSGYYGKGGGGIARSSPMFAHGDGGPARVADHTRTWKDERANEMRRQSNRVFYKVVFPPPIPIISLPPLALNDWLGWHGLD